MPRPLLVIALLALLALPCASSMPDAGAAPATRAFPWVSPFESGVYIGDILPEGISESDYETMRRYLGGKDVEALILNAGKNGFSTVCIGLYDEKKRDVHPLWISTQLDDLPFTIESLPFDGIFIKFTYLPGDKYVSCNFKMAVEASFGKTEAKLKIFRVSQDMDYAGASLASGDFILAGDSGAYRTLSHRGDNDYSDLVFVLRQKPEPPIPLSRTFLVIGGCGLIGLTWWSFRLGKNGLTE